jgi:tight adherence protein C
MTWLIALTYVAAGSAAVGGFALRDDPRVLGRIAPDESAAEQPRPGVRGLVGRKLPLPGARAKAMKLVGTAGGDEFEVDRILGTKIIAAGAGVTAGITTWPNGGLTSLVMSAVLGAAGFALPNFLLGRRVAAVRAEASAAAPDLLDAVAVCVTAGLSPRTALDRAGAVVRGALGQELEEARRQVALGTQWRSALRGVAERTGLPELRRLSITLERSERLGSPVADQLRRLARDVRDERRLRDEERARRAPVAMLFPLVLCILPAFVLAAVVPAMLVAARDIG